jgi:hypothetical protein
VDLDDIDAGRNRTARSVTECSDGSLDVRGCHCAWVRHCVEERDRGRRDNVARPPAVDLGRDERGVQPRRDHRRLAAGVRELDRNLLALRVREVDDLCAV